MVGTRSLSLEGKGFSLSFCWATWEVQRMSGPWRRGSWEEGRLLTVVVDHDLDVAEDLAVPPVSLIAGLGDTAQALRINGAVGLRVEHKGHGQQPLDPFCVLLAVSRLPRAKLAATALPMNWSRR